MGTQFTAAQVQFTNSSTITGGNGGSGGSADPVAGGGGNGGGGGAGVVGGAIGLKLSNLGGTIIGGTGGAAGTGLTVGSVGVGGVEVIGSDMTIINSGTITGGFNGDGTIRANAITFLSGVNTLTLHAGSAITGNVVAFSANDTLALGGTADSTFDVSQIGASAQYQNFGAFHKNGTSTWTLTGTTAEITPWTINAGTLAVSQDASLGDASGGLSFNGGTLRFDTAFTTGRTITLNAGGGTIDVEAGPFAGLSGDIGGNGGITKTGAGILVLSGNNSYGGPTAVNAGTLVAASNSALPGDTAVKVNLGAGFALGDGVNSRSARSPTGHRAAAGC